MKTFRIPYAVFLVCALGCAQAEDRAPQSNPAIDMQGYLRASVDAAAHRATRRLSEDDFIGKSREPGVVVLDARSSDKFNELHIKGAINIPFPDLAVARLNAAIPDRSTIILIYCNNNFRSAESAFPSKLPSASLNLATYVALFTYGYRNVYELAPLIDIRDARLEFDPPRGLAALPDADLRGGSPEIQRLGDSESRRSEREEKE